MKHAQSDPGEHFYLPSSRRRTNDRLAWRSKHLQGHRVISHVLHGAAHLSRLSKRHCAGFTLCANQDLFRGIIHDGTMGFPEQRRAAGQRGRKVLHRTMATCQFRGAFKAPGHTQGEEVFQLPFSAWNKPGLAATAKLSRLQFALTKMTKEARLGHWHTTLLPSYMRKKHASMDLINVTQN